MWGIFGRASGKCDGFAYSEAHKITAIGWSGKHLLEHLVNPKEYHCGASLAAPQVPRWGYPWLESLGIIGRTSGTGNRIAHSEANKNAVGTSWIPRSILLGHYRPAPQSLAMALPLRMPTSTHFHDPSVQRCPFCRTGGRLRRLPLSLNRVKRRT